VECVVAYVTVAQARRESRSVWANRSLAESELRKSASASRYDTFDIFMSHSYEDAEVIAGIKRLIEREGLSVYIDWIEDAQADRSQVTASTADLLRRRMKQCRFLLYASSNTSPDSKWMPWELGYFDGIKPNQVGVLPIVQSEDERFIGQEYLGLYPSYELLNFLGYRGKSFGRLTGTAEGEMLVYDVARAA
jgi:hypothetical protein